MHEDCNNLANQGFDTSTEIRGCEIPLQSQAVVEK